MSTFNLSCGNVFVFNGPSELRGLENLDLAGTSLIFNGGFDLQNLRNVNLHGATIYINGENASTSFEYPQSPRRRQRPSVDRYRPRQGHTVRTGQPASIGVTYQYETGRDAVTRTTGEQSLKASRYIHDAISPLSNDELDNEVQNDPHRLSPVSSSSNDLKNVHPDRLAITRGFTTEPPRSEYRGVKRIRSPSPEPTRGDKRIRADTTVDSSVIAKVNTAQDRILEARTQYAIAERELRRERRQHGRASEEAIHRVRSQGRKLADLYAEDSLIAEETTITAVARGGSEEGELL